MTRAHQSRADARHRLPMPNEDVPGSRPEVAESLPTGLMRNRMRAMAQSAQRLTQASAETAAGLRLDENLLDRQQIELPNEPERSPDKAEDGDDAGESSERPIDRRRIRFAIPIRVAAVTILIAAVILTALLSRDTGPEPIAIKQSVSVSPESEGSPPPSSVPGSATAVSETSSAEVTVHVAGQVTSPGLQVLAPGARVADAIAAAGGPLPEADLTAINLARILVDGEQIFVPLPGEATPPTQGGGAGGSQVGGGQGSGGAALVNINTADATALDDLPGVGPVLAQRIIDWRATNGRFSSVDDLLDVPGIGPAVLAKLRDSATV